MPTYKLLPVRQCICRLTGMLSDCSLEQKRGRIERKSMKKPLFRRLMALLLCAIVLVFYVEMYRYNVTPVLADLNQDIQDAKDEQAAISEAKKDTENKIAELKKITQDTSEYMAKLDEMIITVDGELYELGNKIAEKELKIEETKKELAKAEAEQAHQNEMMKLRIKFMYEHNDESYIAMMLASESLADMLNKAEYVSKISEYDRNMLESYKAAVEYVATVKSQLEVELAELNESKLAAEKKKSSIQLLQEEKAAELKKYNEQMQSLTDRQEQLKKDDEQVQATIDKLLEQQRQESASDSGNGNGNANVDIGPSAAGFIWPTISKRITSWYGATNNRPVAHGGIDIGAVKPGVWGDPIYAAKDGTVEVASYNSSYGYWIMLNHGNGLRTLYCHTSKFYVKEGDKVKQGQTIALMGSTGNSTGAHLHFAVNVNGHGVDPAPYLGIKR